jgi:hypothetical protein
VSQLVQPRALSSPACNVEVLLWLMDTNCPPCNSIESLLIGVCAGSTAIDTEYCAAYVCILAISFGSTYKLRVCKAMPEGLNTGSANLLQVGDFKATF